MLDGFCVPDEPTGHKLRETKYCDKSRIQDAGEKAELKNAFGLRLVFFDSKIAEGHMVRTSAGDVPMPSAKDWEAWLHVLHSFTPSQQHLLLLQALLDRYRADAARAGLLIRPNLDLKFAKANNNKEPDQAIAMDKPEEEENAAMAASPRDAAPTFTPSVNLYLQTQFVKHGVFQLQRAAGLQLATMCFC